jgi:hypothetical protein
MFNVNVRCTRQETRMTELQKLIDHLRKVEALFAGTTFEGEREAAAQAMLRIREKLRQMESTDASVEYKFSLQNDWSRKLMTALMRRYDIRPYRYTGQRRTTLMALLPKSFVDETLWPEFVQLDELLRKYLDEVTERVISEGIYDDVADAEVRREPTGGLLSPPTVEQ